MTTTTGVNLDHVTAQGPITISGVTINTITQMAARPPLWANVPALPNHFLGRDQLVDDLVQRLLAGQSTALSAEGLPGVGKTTLAVVLAHHPAVLAHFSDGVLWAGLANALDVDVSDQPTPAARAQIVRNVIGQRRILLVIDDAWHADAAGLLRCGGPGCAHLLTTRNQAIARQFAGVAQAVSVPTLEDDPAFAGGAWAGARGGWAAAGFGVVGRVSGCAGAQLFRGAEPGCCCGDGGCWPASGLGYAAVGGC